MMQSMSSGQISEPRTPEPRTPEPRTPDRGDESRSPNLESESESPGDLPEAGEDATLDQNDRSAKGSEWWGEPHAPPSPGNPDHKHIFVRPTIPVPSDEAKQIVQKWKATLEGDGTMDPSPIGEHLRQSTPPLKRFEKARDRLSQRGLEVTDEMQKSIFDQFTQNTGLLASLQEYAADKKEIPVELVQELIRQMDRMKMEFATQNNFQYSKSKALKVEIEELERDVEHDVEGLEAEKAHLSLEIAKLKQKLEETIEKAEKNEERDKNLIKRLEVQMAERQKTIDEMRLQKEIRDASAKAIENDEEETKADLQGGNLNQISPDELASAQEKVKRLQKERAELQAAFETVYKEILQETASWGLLIKIIASDPQLVNRMPIETRKVIGKIHENMTEIEKKVLLNWPGFGPSLEKSSVEKAVLTKIAFDKAEKFLKQQLDEMMELSAETEKLQNQREERIRALVETDRTQPASPIQHQWGSTSPVSWDVPDSNASSPFVSDVDEQKSPKVTTDKPEGFKGVIQLKEKAQGTLNKGKGIAQTEERDGSFEGREDLERRLKEKSNEVEKVQGDLILATIEIEQLKKRLKEARDADASPGQSFVKTPSGPPPAPIDTPNFQPQLTSIEGLLSGFDGPSDDARVEPNNADRFNYFNIQYVLKLRTMILKALQYESSTNARHLLDVFGTWYEVFGKELSKLDYDVAHEIDGSRLILEGYWHLWHNQDPVRAQAAVHQGCNKLSAVDDEQRIAIYLKIGETLVREMKMPRNQQGGEGSGQGASG